MISLIIPAYNENLIIENTLNILYKYFSENFDNYEIIVVDDGSTDNMYNTVKNMIDKGYISNTKIIHYKKNRGKGYAVRQGIIHSKGDYIFFTDADIAYGVTIIKKGYLKIKNSNSDVIIGSRKLAIDGYKNYPLKRYIASRVFSFITSVISNLSYDTQCGFKGFKKTVAKDIFKNCVIDRFAFDFEAMIIAKKLDYKIIEIGVSVINHRESKVNIFVDSIRMIKDIIKVKIITERRFRK